MRVEDHGFGRASSLAQTLKVQVAEGVKPGVLESNVSKVGGAPWRSADKSFHHFSDGPMTENAVGLLSGGTGKASAMSCFKRCMT